MARKSSWTHLYLLLIRVSDVCVCVCDGFSFCFTVNRGDVTGKVPRSHRPCLPCYRFLVPEYHTDWEFGSRHRPIPGAHTHTLMLT